jgi:hypothetical protein
VRQLGPYHFKVADSPEEFAAIHRLNYETFVREIPQHEDHGEGQLVDKFHEKNTYLVCHKDGQLVGMLCFHGSPPFSAADRMPNPELLGQPGMRPLEVRLMTVIPEERNSPTLSGLVWLLNEYAITNGYTHFIISSIDKQRELHHHLGFTLLGPDVGPPHARYAPMIATLEQVDKAMGRSIRLLERRMNRQVGVKNGNHESNVLHE